MLSEMAEEEAFPSTTDTEPDPEDEQEATLPGFDHRDETIAQNQRTIQRLKTHFRKSVRALRLDFANYVQQSTELQQSMLDRIIQLNAQIKGIREREDSFLRPTLTPQKSTPTKKCPGAKRKGSAKPNHPP
jgi:hypothetical protein